MSFSGPDVVTMISRFNMAQQCGLMVHAIPEIVIVEFHNSYYLIVKIIILPTHLSLHLH